MSTFRGGEEEDYDGRPTDKASMETRALALVLSGALPPTIDLEDCNASAILVLASDAGLLLQKALTTG